MWGHILIKLNDPPPPILINYFDPITMNIVGPGVGVGGVKILIKTFLKLDRPPTHKIDTVGI